MLDSVFGLPVHPLIVHATVVIVPLAALSVALASVWPWFRAWAGWLPLALSVVGVVLVPLTTGSGESLQERVPETALIEKHADMAEGLLPWVIVLAVGALALAYVRRQESRGTDTTSSLPKGLVLAAAAVALIGAVGTTVQVARIGHSGAKASWSEVKA